MVQMEPSQQQYLKSNGRTGGLGTGVSTLCGGLFLGMSLSQGGQRENKGS